VLGEEDSLPAVRERVGKVRDMAAQVLNEVHDLALQLRPSVLDDLGLLAALRDLHKEFMDRFRLPVDFQVLGLDGRRLPARIETALYRIVQEALTNVARHAQARGVSVLLECRRSAVKLIVEDDGVGFDAMAEQHAGSRDRLGLYGMRERASLVGGQLVIESSPGLGTAVYVEIPLDGNEGCRGPDPTAGR
jgi:signal transduction histidine kinase